MRVFALAPASASVLMLVFSLLAGADSASAKPTDEQLAAIKANCRSDFMSNCWGVPRGGAEAFQCLKDHLASLSGPCQQAVKAVLAAAAPSESGTPAAAAKPAGDTKPAAAAADSASPPGPAGTSNGATSGTAGQSSPAGSAATQATAAPAAAGQSTPATNAKEGRTGAVPTQQSNAQAKKALSASSNGSSQSAIGAAAVNASEAAANSKSAATEATAAPVTPATTGTARPPGIGFIPPRKKFLLARACRDDFNAHCPGVDLGQGRAISCLEANKASLTTDCRDALAKLMH